MKIDVIEVTPRTGLIIGFTMTIVGLLFLLWKIDRISTEIQSYSWKQGSAKVQSVNFYTKSSYSNGRTRLSHFGEFSYSYEVDGKEYIGNRFDAKGDMHTGLEGKAKEAASKLKKSQIISIYYNVKNPSESLIRNGITEDTWVRLCFSIFLLLVGGVTIRYQIKRLAEQGDAPDQIGAC